MPENKGLRRRAGVDRFDDESILWRQVELVAPVDQHLERIGAGVAELQEQNRLTARVDVGGRYRLKSRIDIVDDDFDSPHVNAAIVVLQRDSNGVAVVGVVIGVKVGVSERADREHARRTADASRWQLAGILGCPVAPVNGVGKRFA
jgi:hypothetical protein